VKTTTYDAFGEPPTPAFFLSYRDRPRYLGEVHLRARPGSETLLAAEVQRAVREINASLPVYNVRTMTQHVEMSLAMRRIPARMFLVLGPLILLLAAIGIYAVVSYTVSRRTTEIGVRIALGATGGRVIAQIVRDGLRVIAIGAAAGWAVAFMVAIHVVRGAPVDLTAFIGVPVLLLIVGAAACWVPARRASRVDPVVALRALD
jgi:ABC-type lipoprotein release transport system permease subunit